MSPSISFTVGGVEVVDSRGVTALGLTKPPCNGGQGSNTAGQGGQVPNRLYCCSRGLKKGAVGRQRRLECCMHRGQGRLSLLSIATRGAVSKPLLDWPLLCGAAACAGGKLRSRWAAESHTCDGQAAEQ